MSTSQKWASSLNELQPLCILATHSNSNTGQTCRSVEGDVFGPSGLVNVRVYEMLRTFTPLDSVSSGHEDKITSVGQTARLLDNSRQ